MRGLAAALVPLFFVEMGRRVDLRAALSGSAPALLAGALPGIDPKMREALTECLERLGVNLEALKSGKTSAQPKDGDEKASKATTGLKLSLGLIAPIFVICVLSLPPLATIIDDTNRGVARISGRRQVGDLRRDAIYSS